MLRRLVARLRRRADANGARLAAYERELAQLRPLAERDGMAVVRYPVFESGDHPQGYIDFECRFAAWHLRGAGVRTVLDIGSYRQFVIGLAASLEVTSLDVRPRGESLAPERVVTGDAREIPLPDAAFDAVVSLSSIEHFGLGRYGDAMRWEADREGAAEMRRLVRPGGLLVLTTTVTRGRPVLAFNAHRIYSAPAIRGWMDGWDQVDERFFSHRLDRECAESELVDAPGDWDVYCGCWRAPGA